MKEKAARSEGINFIGSDFSRRLRDGSALPQCTSLVHKRSLQREILREKTAFPSLQFGEGEGAALPKEHESCESSSTPLVPA